MGRTLPRVGLFQAENKGCNSASSRAEAFQGGKSVHQDSWELEQWSGANRSRSHGRKPKMKRQAEKERKRAA
jgi:hypothetical protein